MTTGESSINDWLRHVRIKSRPSHLSSGRNPIGGSILCVITLVLLLPRQTKADLRMGPSGVGWLSKAG
jgi:hypothetical protein